MWFGLVWLEKMTNIIYEPYFLVADDIMNDGQVPRYILSINSLSNYLFYISRSEKLPFTA